MSLADIDEAPGLTLDWLIAIDDAVSQVEAEKRREAGSEARRRAG